MKNRGAVIIITLIALLALFQTRTYAADLVVTCTTAKCTSSHGSLFYETNIAPGFSTSKTIRIDNINNTDTCNLYLQTTRDTALGIPDLSNMINMVIKRESTILLSNIKMSDLFSQSILLGSINAGSTAEYIWEATFDPASSNDYQASTVSFDFGLNFTCSSTPQNDPSSQNIGGNITQVLGEEIRADHDIRNSGESMNGSNNDLDNTGRSILGSECEQNYPWWIFLLIQAILSLILILTKTSRRSKRRVWPVLILFGILSQAIHMIVGCGCLIEYWCSNYIYLNLGIVVTSLAIYITLIKNRLLAHTKSTLGLNSPNNI